MQVTKEVAVESRRKVGQKDQVIAGRVRKFRQDKGMSQTELGRRIGVTFQQIQKYEKGTNRIGAGRLHDIAVALGVPIIEFFDGLEKATKSAATKVA